MLHDNALKRLILANFKFLFRQNREMEKKSYPLFLNLHSLHFAVAESHEYKSRQ